MRKFYAEVIDNKDVPLTIEGKAEKVEQFETKLLEEGMKILKMVPARGHHVCQYCHGIADGADKDILCNDCAFTFGHRLFSEL